MIDIRTARDLSRLRKQVLARQGLLSTQAFGRGLPGTLKAVQHLGYVQIDSISVVERAHHHVLYSRVPGYRPPMLDKLLEQRAIFEFWSHAAAFLPMQDYRFSLPYKHAIRDGQTHWYTHPDRALMADILARVRSDGPLRARDLDTPRRSNASGWWDWKPAKKAVEQLYMQGDLMISQRDGFQKSYDLTERVLPAHISTEAPTDAEFAAHLLEQQLRGFGFATHKSTTYLRRNKPLREAVKRELNERLREGSLQQVRLPGGELILIEAGLLDAPSARASARMQILSPFDNMVIQRERLKALFDFDYQIECYVPAAKRRYGYFSLPLLFAGQFVGRLNCKAHRKRQELEIIDVHLEDHGLDHDSLCAALAEALVSFADFNGCSVLNPATRVTDALKSTRP